ncbi:MAG: 16S rRNA (cytosine(967)-C(5))-methyltransferase RsmB [Clostridia bacterium]
MTLTPLYYTYKCLDSIIRQGAFSGIELNKYLTNAKTSDKPMITKLVYGVLDKDIELRYIINNYTEKVKPSIMPILEIGVYLLKYMNIKDYAAVNETVELSRDIGKGAMSGFINAVLKKISSELNENKIKYPQNAQENLSIKYSFPLWAVKKLIAQIGYEETEAFLMYEPDYSVTHIRLNPSKINSAKFEEILIKRGIEYKPSLVDDAYFVKSDGIKKLEDNLYTIQSIGSMLVAQAAQAEGEVLDNCAAPGGKSVYIKQRTSAEVTACDIYAHRVELIKSYAARMGVKINAIVNDATKLTPEFINKFDRVLCDVPCSGYGVYYSKPDIKMNKNDRNIKELVKLQSEILNQASKYVKVNGKLIYSTCTIFKEENIDVIDEFLKENDFILEKAPLPKQLGEAPYIEGKCVQLYPYRDGTEGFFIAVMRRIK